MAERKKVTLEDLIKRKMELKQERKYEGELFIPSLGGDIQIEVFKNDVVDFLEISQSDKHNEENAKKAGHNLVYSIVKSPNLADKNLQESFECEEPTDIVQYIFAEAEILDIVDYSISVVGMRRGVIQEVKN